MFKKKKKSPTYRFYHKKNKDKKSPSKLREILILVLALFVLVYIFSLAKRISQNQALGKSETKTIRMQILNGTKEKNALEKVASWLKQKNSDTLIFDILELQDLEDTVLTPCLVLDRTKEGGKGEIVSQTLGISSSNLILKPLENNYKDIEVTVILGNDYKELFFPQTELKEKNKEGKR